MICHIRMRVCQTLAVLVLASCRAEPSPQEGPHSHEGATHLERAVGGTAWDTLARYGGEADTTLGELWLTAIDSSMFVVWDNVTQQAHAFDLDLNPLWTAGTKGSGPGEFRQARSISFARDGELVVFDVAAQRLTFLTRLGKLRESLNVPEAMEQVVSGVGDSLLGFAPNRAGSPIAAFGRALEESAPLSLPWDGYPRLHPLLRGAFLSADPYTGDAALAMTYGNGWFGVSGGVVASYVGRYLEDTPMPTIKEDGGRRLITGGELAGQAVAVRDGVVTILFEGMTENAKRWLDRFRVSDGAYLGSLLLPQRINGFNVGPDGSYYVVFNNPAPTLLKIRPTLLAEGRK